MDEITINTRTVDEILGMIRWAVHDINAHNFHSKDIRIYMSYYVETAIRFYYDNSQLNINTLGHGHPLKIMGCYVYRGYDQHKVVISNCADGYLPDRIINHVISYKDERVLLNSSK